MWDTYMVSYNGDSYLVHPSPSLYLLLKDRTPKFNLCRPRSVR